MTTLAVTDTHALIWAACDERKRLGKKARRLFEQVEEGRGSIYVPTVSLVEIAEALRKGSINLPLGFEEWTRALLSSGRYHAADLTPAVVLRAQTLYAIPERTDRLIAATALELDCPLITRDPELMAAADVDVIW